ncbi:reverse transcriptase domain-containing protein [Tanacetum coccineum]
MAAREVVNLMVSYQADDHRRESEEFYTQHQDAQGDRAALLDEVDTLRRYLSSLCTTHEQERVKARQALDRPEAYNKALKAQIIVLETQAYRHEWQRQDAYDHASGHIIRIQALETGARVDTLEEIATAQSHVKSSLLLALCKEMLLRDGTPTMFPEESDEIEKYVGGLPYMIHKSVMTSKPKTMQDAIEFATELMDKKIITLAEPYTARSGERKEYDGTLPLCNKCKFHHNGHCTIKCTNCKRVVHLTRDCRSPTTTNNQRNLNCYECGNQGHCRSDCPELKNQNHGNQAGGTGARGMVHSLRRRETNQDLNNMENDINA